MSPVTHTGGFQSRTVGDIAATLPGATRVFRRHKLDFCCGGDVPLSAAAAGRGLSLADLEAELAALESGAPQPVPQTTPDLIAHIVARFHQAHRAELPEMVRLARKVEAVHAMHPGVPAGLGDHLAGMAAELASHMDREEEVLFPMLLTGGCAVVAYPIARMRLEHSEHGEALARLRQLAHDFEPPFGACRTWQALYAGLAKLTDDLMEHIHLENNVLFPRFAGH